MTAGDLAGLESVIGRHLWLVASKRCSCGIRPNVGLGHHYAWFIHHLASELAAAGYAKLDGAA